MREDLLYFLYLHKPQEWKFLTMTIFWGIEVGVIYPKINYLKFWKVKIDLLKHKSAWVIFYRIFYLGILGNTTEQSSCQQKYVF